MFEKKIKTAEMLEEQMDKVTGGTGNENQEAEKTELAGEVEIKKMPVLPLDNLA